MRQVLLAIVLGAAALAAGFWVVSRTEWTDQLVPTPAQGDAAVNPLYALQALMRELGATVVKRESLDTLPPASARLVLVSRHWDLLPQRAEKLRGWVTRGGHLVIPSHMLTHGGLSDWLPVGQALPANDASRAEPPAAPSAARPSKAQRPGASAADQRARDEDCHTLRPPLPGSDTQGEAASQASAANLKVCGGWATRPLFVKNGMGPALWSLHASPGTQVVRVRFGAGSVTVVNGWPMFTNLHLLRADNPLLAVTALQASAGAEVWFVAEESRAPLVGWLWQNGWPAAVLAGLALLLALWRAAVRALPAGQPQGPQRRSMAEQVRGTGRFLQRHGPAALHAAQARALGDAARRHLRGFARMDAARQALAIAEATGLDAAALARALQASAPDATLPVAALALMETARRRLHEMPATTPPGEPPLHLSSTDT